MMIRAVCRYILRIACPLFSALSFAAMTGEKTPSAPSGNAGASEILWLFEVMIGT